MDIYDYSAKLKRLGKGQVYPGISFLKFIWKKINDWITALFTITACLAILIAWRLKRLELITPQHGIGYLFGVLGTAFMLILFIYSLKKRISSLGIGSVKTWFRIHMFFGIIGPLFILFHANLSLGSLNSNVALFSMLVVMFSGLMGRFIYGRIHYGLYGELANLKELKENFDQQKERADLYFSLIQGAKEELISFSNDVLTPSAALIDSIKRFLIIRWKSERAFWKITRLSNVYINQCALGDKWGFFRKRRMQIQIQRRAREFLNQTVKFAEFNFYERMFSFWHLLHIPLVIILVLAVIMHIFAANRY